MENFLRMTERTRGWFLTITIALLSLCALSCSDEPTQDNALLSPAPLTGITVRDTTIVAVNDSTFKQYIPMEGSLDLVGRTPASGPSQGYTAYAALQFYPAYFPLRDTINVLSATLTLHLRYRLGDAAAPFEFDVYRATRSWDATRITWDSVQAGLYDPSVTHGSFSATVPSDSDSVVVTLDTSLVRQWLSSAASADRKYGIVLVPAMTSSSVRGFVGFGGSDSVSEYPTLQIIASNVSGTVRDTTRYTTGEGTFVGDGSLSIDPGIIYLQSGVAYRSKLAFDVSFIPRGAIINSTLLSLDLAPGFPQVTSLTTDSSIAAHLLIGTDPTNIEAAGATLKPAAGSSMTFSGDISRAVQSWVRGPNNGVVLRCASPAENSRLDLYGFYGSRAPQTGMRPRLKIIYSVGS